jgi:hypothetical protein
MKTNEYIMLVASTRIKSAAESLYHFINVKDFSKISTCLNLINYYKIDLTNAQCNIITESMRKRYLHEVAINEINKL